MATFSCKKCGSIDLFTTNNGTQHGLYCKDCGAWIKWLGKEEARLAELQIKSTFKYISENEIDLSQVSTDDLLNEIKKRIKC